MNELDDLVTNESLEIINPVYKMINYFIAGLILLSFRFDFLFFGTLGNVISSILLFLGFRLVKKANQYFYFAYIITVFFLVVSGVNVALLVTPLTMPEWINICFFVINIIRVCFMCQGLKMFVKDKSNVNKVFLSYLGLGFIGILGSLFNEKSIILIIAFIVVFVYMIKKLLKAQRDVIDHGFMLELSRVRMNSSIFVSLYSFILVVLMCISHYVYPYVICQKIEVPDYDYSQYELLNSFQKDGSCLDIYDYNKDQYLYVYKFTTQHIKKPIKSVTVILYHNVRPGGFSLVSDFTISDGKNRYLTQKANQINDYTNFADFKIGHHSPYVQMAYLEPNFDFDYTIQFALVTSKSIPYNEGDEIMEDTSIEDAINLYYHTYDSVLLLDKDTPNIHDLYFYHTIDGKLETPEIHK